MAPHDVMACNDCSVVCTSSTGYAAHLRSRGHARRISGSNTLLHCPLCNLNVVGSRGWIEHLQSKRHLNKVDPTTGEVAPELPESTEREEFCNTCNTVIPRHAWQRHLQTSGHLKKERYTAYKSVSDEAEKDKHGIAVSGSLDFGIVEPADAQQGIRLNMSVENSVPLSRVVLVEARLSSFSGKGDPPSFSINIPANSLITSSRRVTTEILFRATFNGRYDDRLEIIFEDQALSKRFAIVRPIQAIIGSKADHELLKPKSPYVPRIRRDREAVMDVVLGVAPPALDAITYVVKLTQSPIPKELAGALVTGAPQHRAGNIKRLFLPQIWNSDTYSRHMKHLIWVEEFQMDLDVPGLSENRPSVLIGDQILVKPIESTTGRWFSGHVHFVHMESVGLRFHSSFSWSAGQKYNIRFKLNRIPLRRQHQALDTAFTQDRVLFPEPKHVQAPFPPRALTIVNKLIATNPNQLMAVKGIVNQQPGSVPFIVFGPPGTGKTVTMVEAIRQLYLTNSNARILACAPSNSAADLIASRLKDLGPAVLFRFYAPSRKRGQVPDELLPFTSIKHVGANSASESYFATQRDSAAGLFTVPPMARLKRFRIIVCTCVSASFPYGVGLPRGHFSHLFFDEAGHATEPETMIAIKTMADNDTNIVLSGDPRQLGPIIRSKVATALGLEISYMERLMNDEMYDEQKAHGRTVVKLVMNFRSHNAILKFPNERFYRGELRQCGDPKVINAYIGSSHLVSKKFPIIFHSISGKDDREASSPSFFNIDEATQVKAYIQALRADNKIKTSYAEIGVIAPYYAQCLKLRKLLRAIGAEEVKVGSVEEFQGQERKVIIVSTVRSSREWVTSDVRHALGFVANPRRFNVSVTRAQALLIVVGDPNILALDPLWSSFLRYIKANGGWKGPSPSANIFGEDVDEGSIRADALADMSRFTRRIEALTLAGVGDEEDANAADSANIDRPWRILE
ncbi:hypothetical protein HWV62_21353 [Athelia sp. TMB]|nr:hypothetical protein HWV62_38106 [Athelia sp. TMB]KAF7971342.1 hypothetical protein HWV62_21353 [Athelia sp. TMB]